MRKPVYGKTCCLSTVNDIAGLRADPQALKLFLSRPTETDIHIYWHAITYLLTGEVDGGDEPLCYLLKGGETIGQTEAGPVRYLTSDQITRFANAIADVSPDDMGEELYDLETLDAKHIYRECWQLDGEDNDLLSNIRELYSYLRGFAARAARQDRGVIVFYKNTKLYFETE